MPLVVRCLPPAPVCMWWLWRAWWQAPRLRTDAYADERESRFTVQGANFLSAPMLRKLFTAASGGGA